MLEKTFFNDVIFFAYSAIMQLLKFLLGQFPSHQYIRFFKEAKIAGNLIKNLQNLL